MLALNVTYEVRMCTHRCPQPTAMHGRRQPVMARWRPKSAPVPPPPAFSGWRAARAPAARVLPSPAAQPAGNLPPSLFHATLCACCFIFRVFCSSFCIVSSIFRGFLSTLRALEFMFRVFRSSFPAVFSSWLFSCSSSISLSSSSSLSVLSSSSSCCFCSSSFCPLLLILLFVTRDLLLLLQVSWLLLLSSCCGC